jgi:uncharacterized membrane protein
MRSSFLFSFKKVLQVLRSPVGVFLILGGFFGLCYLLLVPPFLQPDESAHFDRVYQVAEGHITGQKLPDGYGMYLPGSIVAFEHVDDAITASPGIQRISLGRTLHLITQPWSSINEAQKDPSEFVNTEVYNPIVYSPQIAAMTLARIFNFSVPITFYLVRLFGFTCWLLMCAYGISKLKTLGWAVVVILLTPLCLHIVSSVTADSMTIAFSILFVGLIFDALTIKKLSRNKMIALLASITLLACVKIPYELLGMLVILIPNSTYKNTKQKMLLLAASVVIFLSVTGVWTLVAQKQYISYRTVATGIVLDQKKQELYLLQHPLSFGHKLYDTYLRSNPYALDPVWSYVGVLGATGYNIPSWAVCLYFALFGAVIVKLRDNAKKSDYLIPSRQWFTTAVATCLFLAINAIIFISWSRIKIPIIEGIQSRYFIPILPLLIFILLPVYKRAGTFAKTSYYFIPVLLLLIQLATLAAVYYQFYIAPMPVISS